jgi:hypothetical protein
MHWTCVEILVVGLRTERRLPVGSFVSRTFERDEQLVGRNGEEFPMRSKRRDEPRVACLERESAIPNVVLDVLTLPLLADRFFRVVWSQSSMIDSESTKRYQPIHHRERIRDIPR